MTRVPTVRRTDLDRSLAALKAAGHEIAGVTIKPGGEVMILTGQPSTSHQSASVSALDAWREQRRGQGAA
ncbi:Uncharacterised protein [Brevundimonas diminuta]|uniref:Uncharacterized protein n=1 Tax=Brevundimonas diminuta TaxID=293 RepID=A0A2X1AHF7_BREDI|nr:Uncharacterised protein [Brevundimonas diminuta]